MRLCSVYQKFYNAFRNYMGHKTQLKTIKVSLKCSIYDLDLIWHELLHNKSDKVACVHSKDSDQPGHLLSLIRIFYVVMEVA